MANNTSILFFESNVDWIHFICVKQKGLNYGFNYN